MVAEAFEGGPDPVGEVGLAAAFEFEQASGQRVGGSGQGKVVAKIEMPDLFIIINYMCRLQPHPLSCLME
jgi:hypothetical protein